MKKALIAVLFFVSAVFCFSEDTWLALGARLGGSAHFYKLGSDLENWYSGYNVDIDSYFSFDGAVQAALNISDMFAVQTELLFTKDTATGIIHDSGYVVKESFESNALLIPLLAKASFRPENYVLSGLAGIYFTVPLGDMKEKYTEEYGGSTYSESYNWDFEKVPLGFMIGASGGIKLGSGNLFADLRYAMDFSETEASTENVTLALYKRSMFMFSLGYEIGLIGRGGGVVTGGNNSRRR
jgi:hypothetical protein